MGSGEYFQCCRAENNKLEGTLICRSLPHRCISSHRKSRCKKFMYLSNLSEQISKWAARAEKPFAIVTQQRQPEKSA